MNRIDSLQALRAIAFTCIFLSHCDVIPTGPMGVSIFLILSGFLMFYSWDNKKKMPQKGIRNAFVLSIRKISKLYPLHLLTFLWMVAVGLLVGFKGGHTLLKGILNLLLLQAWVPSAKWYFTFNKVSWYLSVCLFVYFVFPFIYRRISRMTFRKNAVEGGYCSQYKLLFR
jgi:peptidoglycan/LPS O-acetylase OafA/YrhL